MRHLLVTFLKRSTLLVLLVRALKTAMRNYREEQRRQSGCLSRGEAIEAYFRDRPTAKLQIGAGNNILAGWLNTDISPLDNGVVFLDASDTFPFDDNVFEYIFSEHMIEHVTYTNGLQMLRECFRVLKPGGFIRIATPHADRLVSLYDSEHSDIQKRFTQYIIDKYIPEAERGNGNFVVNMYFRGFTHEFLYDRRTLQCAMTKAGFIDIRQYLPDCSDDVNLRGIECNGRVHGEDINRFVTLVLEGRRPNPS